MAGLDGVGAGAVRFAAGQVITEKSTRTFDSVVAAAYANRIQLWSDGFYRTPKIHYDKTTLTGRPFYYFAYGAAVSEGGFVQGMGWLTTEQLVWKADGTLATHAPSTYKIPATGDIPEHLRVDLWPEPNREDNVHGSKAVGEPPLMLAISVFEALRDAVAQAGGQPEAMNAPATAEEVLRSVSPLQ